MNKVDKDDILSHPSLPVIYTIIRGLAQELAILGKIDFASRITDLLLSQNGTEHGIGLMRCLNFAFEQTGDWPSVIPTAARSKKALDELEGPPAGPMDEKKYNELMNETDLCGRDPALCLTIAVVLCEKEGRTDVEEIRKDERVVRALEQITEHFHDYIDALTQHRRIWPLLASGVLAEHLGVDDATLCATAEDVVETVRIRIEQGRQKGEHEGLPIKQLLEVLVENTRKNAGTLYEENDQDPPENYLHDPATPQDIADLEQRLKIPSLPADYKDFLLTSNGLEAVYNGQTLTPPLFNTQNVLLSDLPSTVSIPLQLPLQLVESPSGTAQLAREAGMHNDWPCATQQLEIGRSYEPVFLLTAPADVKRTVEAYNKALNSDKVSDVVKKETRCAIEDLYSGGMEAFEKMEWALMFSIDFDPYYPVGTFRTWLEETVRRSGRVCDRDSGDTCLAYACRAE